MRRYSINPTSVLCFIFIATALGLFLFHTFNSLSVPLGFLGDHQRYQRAANFHRGVGNFKWWQEDEYKDEINKHPAYIITLSCANSWGLDVPRLSLLLVLISAAVLCCIVKSISGPTAGLLAGGLFLASPFILSQTLIFASHGHLGVLFALIALWIVVSGYANKALPAFFIGVLCATAVLASFHSLLIVIPLLVIQIISQWRRNRLALLAGLIGILIVIIPLFSFLPQMKINFYVDKILELFQNNVDGAQSFGFHFLLPFYLAFECESGVYSLMILFFIIVSAIVLARKKGEKALRARSVFFIAVIAFILFEMLSVKLNRVYYPIWVCLIAFSASGVLDFFQNVRGKDLRWVVPVLSLLVMFGFCLPASQTIVSTCRAGIEIFPTEESRRGVFVAGDNNVAPLNLPQIQTAVSRNEIKYVIMRKFPLPWRRTLFDNPDSRHLFIRQRVYEELIDAEGVRRLRCWRTQPQFFFFSEWAYTFYREGWWRPGPSLVVPEKLYRKTRAKITRQLYLKK